MKYLVDSKTMKQIDERTQEEYGLVSSVLMERAALAVAEYIRQIQGPSRILAVCGTGNNGGDGIAAARILHEWGYQTEILLIGDVSKGTEQMQAQLTIARKCGVPLYDDVEHVGNGSVFSEYTILIDAIFGIGLSRAVEGKYAELIHGMNASGVPIVSVDIPSGVNADGDPVGPAAVQAMATVTFGYHKIGMQIYPGKKYAGTVCLAEIGFPHVLEKEFEFPAVMYEPEDYTLRPKRMPDGNKGSFGKVLVIGGSADMCGACYLSAKAAFRMGAGMVKIMTVKENLAVLHGLLPEAIVTCFCPDTLEDEGTAEQIEAEMKWADAIVVGPGLGRSSEVKQLVRVVLRKASVPVVVDADALYHIGQMEEYVGKSQKSGSFRTLSLDGDFVLTPHVKEMADLLACEVSAVKKNLVETARMVTEGHSFTLALKDARSVVAGGGCRQVCINNSGNDGMATAGSGDVLTGIIAALLAQGMSCYEATALGVYLHGVAGDKAAARLGKAGCMASDIIDGLIDGR